VKRHAVVDTLGLVWGLCVTPANVADCKGARAAVEEARAASGERLTRLWADSAYRGLVAFCWVLFDLTVEVPTRREGAVGFGGDPAAVGGRADARVAHAVAAAEPELRAHAGE